MTLFKKGKGDGAAAAPKPVAFAPIDRNGLLRLLDQVVNGGQAGILELREPRGNWVYAFQGGALTHASGGRVRGARQAFDLLWEFQSGEFTFTPGVNGSLSGNLYIDKGRLLDLLRRSQAVLQGPSAPYIPPDQQRPIAPVNRPYQPPTPAQMPPPWQPGAPPAAYPAAPGWPQAGAPGQPPGWPPGYPQQQPGYPPAQYPYPAAPGQPYPPAVYPQAPGPMQPPGAQQPAYAPPFPQPPAQPAPPMPQQGPPPHMMPPQAPPPAMPPSPVRPATPPSFSVPPMAIPKKRQTIPAYQPPAAAPAPVPPAPAPQQKDDLAALRASLVAQAPAVRPAPSGAGWGVRTAEGTVVPAAPAAGKGKPGGKAGSKAPRGLKLQLIKFLLWACERRYSPDDHWTVKDAFEVSTMELRDQFFSAFSQSLKSASRPRPSGDDEDDMDDLAAGRMRGRGRRH
jgi:hypothetical protein